MNLGDVGWESISLFKDLTPDMLEKVKPLFDVRGVEAGRNLVSEGEPGDEMFILIRGQVRITKSMLLGGMNLPIMEAGDPRKVLATLDERDYPIFGEIALVDRDIRSATVQVLSDAEFLVTDRDRFFALVEREPGVGARLILALARRMARTVRHGNAELVKVSTALALALSRHTR
ncbi:cyclic nucleotide-binding domain-containing protein [Pseudodesulfovibrio sp.]|uniref:cyclic nucleotide-binding domain-containing protein n=1 Tax=Pseudodesulfovibrio sp. TaxID=2035812 RepID=UPI00261710FE|nr:cyclic nucleotide-binding domain-containing protein [Pseudodesulfovibrio sp.]MDD3312065.1 cyclic nucleotide-binding domain-containing protein [Pseudodesulfovibrio sp.]